MPTPAGELFLSQGCRHEEDLEKNEEESVSTTGPLLQQIQKSPKSDIAWFSIMRHPVTRVLCIVWWIGVTPTTCWTWQAGVLPKDIPFPGGA